MNDVRFSDVIVAFNDFITCLDASDEHDFPRAIRFCSIALKNIAEAHGVDLEVKRYDA